MAGKKNFSLGKTIFLSIGALIVGAIIGFVSLMYYFSPKNMNFNGMYYSNASIISGIDATKSGEFTMHFIEEDTYSAGDIIYIKVGNIDILIDTGASNVKTANKIKTYLAKDECMGNDKTIEYLIVTHAHADHYGNLGVTDSLFDYYQIDTVIDFALTNQKSTGAMYSKYLAKLQTEINEGANHYTAADCFYEENGGQKIYNLDGIAQMEILYNPYYKQNSSSENDYSVCALFTHGTSKFLFCGDIEDKAEKAMVKYYDDLNQSEKLQNVTVYKANHHGSKTSSCKEFIEVINPEATVVMCCAGSYEYTKVKANTFPTQQFIDNMAEFSSSDKVYVSTLCTNPDTKEFESLCGDIVITSKSSGVKIDCSKEIIKLKDSKIFSDNKYGKTLPQKWTNVA